MNVAIVIDTIENLTNGSVMTAKRFADGLRARGHKVKIIAVGANGENDCAVRERYVPILSEVSSKNQIKFAKFDKNRVKNALLGVDVAHFIFPFKFEKLCKRLADDMGVATTCAFHCQPENVSFNVGLGKVKAFNDFIYSHFNRGFYRHFNRIHCPSQFIADRLISHGYRGKLYVISNGYDPAFTPPEQKLESEYFNIVMTGRLSPEKNQSVLIRAVALSKHAKKIRLSLFGNGPNKSKLQRLAQSLNVNAEFSFLDRDALIKKLQQSHLYVHSATVEIEAIATIEAIACGLVPVICNSPLSATPQFALDDRSLFKDGDAVDLAQKIDYWIENKEERRKMEQKYARHALNYSLEKSLASAEQMFMDEISENEALKLPAYT